MQLTITSILELPDRCLICGGVLREDWFIAKEAAESNLVIHQWRCWNGHPVTLIVRSSGRTPMRCSRCGRLFVSPSPDVDHHAGCTAPQPQRQPKTLPECLAIVSNGG